MCKFKFNIPLFGLLCSLLLATALHGSETPEVTSAEVLVVQLGQSFTYELEASNAPLGYSVLDLPYWIEREGNKLVGQGVKVGSHTLKIFALNTHGISQPHTLKITVEAVVKEK